MAMRLCSVLRFSELALNLYEVFFLVKIIVTLTHDITSYLIRTSCPNHPLPLLMIVGCVTLQEALRIPLKMSLHLSQSGVAAVVVVGMQSRRTKGRSEKVNQCLSIYYGISHILIIHYDTEKHVDITVYMYPCHAIELMNNKIP